MQIDFSKEIIDIANELIQMVNQSGGKMVQEEIKESGFYSSVSIILQACQSYANFLEQTIMTQSASVNRQSTDNGTTIIKLGTILIFQLRQFVTNESLQFILAGTTKDKELKEKTYEQDEIFNRANLSNLRISFANAQVELASQIEKLSALQNADSSLMSQWKKVLQYGFTENYRQEELVDDKGAEGSLYHKKEADINVYMKFSNRGRRKTLTYYYMNHIKPTSRDDLDPSKAYDRGWMYQWLKMHYDNIEIDDLSKTPLLDLMSQKSSFRENIAGIKGGDQGLEQYKYRNRRIITFRNMLNILKGNGNYIGLINSLEELLKTQNSPETAFSHLVQDFTTWNSDKIQDFVKERLSEFDLTKENFFGII